MVDMDRPVVHFINILQAHFFVRKSFLCLDFGFERTFLQKMSTSNVARSFFLQKCSGSQLLFYQQNYAQLYKYTQLEVTPNF
jgi:hypothetical protein